MHPSAEVNASSKFHLNDVTSEGEAPAPEISGDVFDRQRVMKNFSQSLVEQQHVFVLGVGGIGSSIAMCLVRMGVDTVHLLDRDNVEASNLNRQILFSLQDVGRSKAEAAAQQLKQMHNLRTNIFDYHTDAVKNWSRVVEIAKKCTVIFNNIDYGAVFDYAVNSLCKALGVLYVAGSTYANNIEINLFSGLQNDPCWACNNSTSDSFKFTAQELEMVSDVHSFFKEKNCISGEQSRSIIEQCLNEVEIKSSLSTSFISVFQEKTLDLLLPQYIQKHPSIEFIPKDRSFPTRSVGSWVGVCVSGSCFIVNTWVQYIMRTTLSSADTNGPFHNWSQLNLSMFDGGYYTAGFPNEQNLNCPICLNAKKLAQGKSCAEEQNQRIEGNLIQEQH